MFQRKIVARVVVLMCAIGLLGTYVVYRGCARGIDGQERFSGSKSAPVLSPKAPEPAEAPKQEESYLGGSKSMRMVEPSDLLSEPLSQHKPPAQPVPAKSGK